MADDWEKEDYVPPSFAKKPVSGDRWEGEDEEDVKENWDDEEEEAAPPAEGEKNATTQPKKKKTLSQIIQEKEEKRRKEAELKKALMEEKAMTPEEIQEEKLRRQQMQEEADLELAKEAFGLDSCVESVDNLNPTTREEFDQLRKAIGSKLISLEKSALYMGFLDELLRDISINMEPEDVKRLSSTLNAVANEKVKQQKTSKHKKKSKKAGASLNVGKDDGLGVLDDYGNDYEDFM